MMIFNRLRAFSYSSLTLLLLSFCLYLILIGHQALVASLTIIILWSTFIVSLIISLVYPTLTKVVQFVVDRLFFKTRYSHQKILEKFDFALARPIIELERFAQLSPYLLTKSMNLTGAAFMALDREKNVYSMLAGEKAAQELEGMNIPADSALAKELLSGRKELALDEIELALKRSTLSEQEKIRLAKVVFELKQLGACLAVPVIADGPNFSLPTLVAMILLGSKVSREPFYQEDIDFLKIIANRSAINIEYSFAIEELKTRQEQMIKTEKMAALGNSCAGIAHELKNPLTYLTTVSQAMTDNWDKPAFKESIMNILPAEIERMKLIIEGLSDYSKSHELRLTSVSLASIIDKALAVLGYEIKKNNVSIIKQYADGVTALGDKDRLVQVFMNIIANAVQAIGSQGGSLTINLAAAGNQVQATIIDTGPGMSQETVNRIFDPFFTTKESGTGLGLSITKKIIDEHQGKIMVQSVFGKGTSFTILLPQAPGR